mgnify:CR=1 FL=1
MSDALKACKNFNPFLNPIWYGLNVAAIYLMIFGR